MASPVMLAVLHLLRLLFLMQAVDSRERLHRLATSQLALMLSLLTVSRCCNCHFSCRPSTGGSACGALRWRPST